MILRSAILAGTASLVALCAAMPAVARVPEESSARLNPSGRDIALGGPVRDGEFIIGEIDYVLTAYDRILIDTQSLLTLLSDRMSSEDLYRLTIAFAGREQVGADELIPFGLTFEYDPSNFGLTLEMDPTLRPRQVISVSGSPTPYTGPVEAPAGFSGYVTAFAVADYVHNSGGGGETGFATPTVFLDSAIRFGGFVLENEASLDEDFSREGTRLVYDDLARTARYTAGDLNTISRGFSGSSSMAGLSVVRTYADLEPGRNIQPRGQRSFTLDRPATVETIINGRSVQQVRLNPGNYDIRDFPFAQGANNVQLLIRDDSGRETTLSFSINFDRTLLEPGLTEFGLFAGVQSRFLGDGIEYSDDPVASGFYRRGLTESLTAGANFQAAADGGVVGGEMAWATPIGIIGADVAVSSIETIGEGYAINVGYERQYLAFGDEPGAFTVTAQTVSDDFATPGVLIADNRFAAELGASVSQSLGDSRFVSADAFHSIGRGAQEDQTTVRTVFGWRTSQRLLWTAEAAYENRIGENDYGVRLGLTYRFSPYSSARAEIDSRRERARVGYQTSRGRGVGAWSATADIEGTPDAAGLNAAFNTTRNRAELGLSHQTFFNTSGGEISDQRTSARVGASIAFADGGVALSRPIYDSFAMVRPHQSLEDAEVYVDPQDRFYTARSGLFGPAVNPDLSAYSSRLITYDAPDAPPGYDLGAGAVQVLPPYRSGYLITVGSDYFLSATGQLVDEAGSPLTLWVGQAVEVAAPDREPVRIFTNGSGRFAIQGLRPGQWRISSATPGGRSYLLDIPADADSLVRAGVLTPEARQ